jgi:methanogenic corrinoid protein MtbC1
MSPGGLNIAALARRTGVAPDTLRKWEQRYAILRPTRTAGGQRRYSELDVARVEWLRARLDEGYRIGEAAALLGIEGSDAGTTALEHREALLAAAAASDVGAVARLLDQAFALHPLPETLTDVVEPVLKEVGESWAGGRFSVAQEHLVSAAVRARIERYLADARGPVRGVAVCACAPGERHELGLLMLSVMLRADGWQVTYLGADTPLDDALELAERVSARLLCISVTMPSEAAQLQHALTSLSPPGGLEIVVGGAAAAPGVVKGATARYVNTSLPNSIHELRKLAK